MEFDEMKKIWDTQSNKAMYAIDEQTLHNRVIGKKMKAAKIADRTEKILIGAFSLSATFIVVMSMVDRHYEISSLLVAMFMYIGASQVYRKRSSRLTEQNSFENSILGDLEDALTNANYQVNLSRSIRYFFVIIALLTTYSVVDSWEEWWQGAIMLVFFGLTYVLAKWEHRTFYVSQKRNLESMKEKLVNLQEDPVPES